MPGKMKKLYALEDWFVSHVYGKYVEYKNINEPTRKRIYQSTKLSREQEQEIDEYFLKHYGKKIPYLWHRYFYGFSGGFDKKFVPDSLILSEYEWLVNPPEYTNCIEDKNITPLLTYGIRDLATPNTVLSCAAGIFRDDEVRLISEKNAKEILWNCGRVFVKPTVETGSGHGCAIIEMENGVDRSSGESIEEILKIYGKNFVVQQCIKTHESIRNIYAGAVNTFRVVTYILPGDRIVHAPTTMRIGQGGGFLDNAHAGGMFIGVDNEGFLTEKAYTDAHNVYFQHPDSNLVFKGHQIPLITKVHEKALEMHARIPQVGLVNWDFTINEHGEVVLIEANVRFGGGVQMAQEAWGKGCFEENTEEILEFLKEKRKKYPICYR